MRAAVFLLVAGALYYAGGVYGVAGLVALASALGAAALLCLALALLSLACLRVALDPGAGEAVRGGEARVELRVENRSPLPAPAFSVALRRTRPDAAAPDPGGAATVFGTASGRRALSVPVAVQAGHCGVVELAAGRLSARDPLGLFAPRRRLRARARMAVLPRGGSPVAVGAEEAGTAPERRAGGGEGGGTGLEPPDVLDVRPWQPGDAPTAVHWKLSARTGELQTKRFAGEDPARAVLLLDFCPDGAAPGGGTVPRGLADAGEGAVETEGGASGPDAGDAGEADPAERFDAWCEAAANLAEGLARAGVPFVAVWPGSGPEGPVREHAVGSPEGVRPFLHALVESHAVRRRPEASRAAAAAHARALAAGGAPLALGADLVLRRDGAPLVRFGADGRPREAGAGAGQ